MGAKREAWVDLPPAQAVRAQMPNHPYDFGFFPVMGRLIAAHAEIGAAFGALFAEIMFVPGALTRREREMAAAVAAAAQDCHY
jgi:hypothetical protein